MHLGHRLPLRKGEGRIWQCLCPAGIDRVTRRPKKNPKKTQVLRRLRAAFCGEWNCFKVSTCLSSPQNLDLGSGKIHEDPVFSCQHVLQFYFSIEIIS